VHCIVCGSPYLNELTRLEHIPSSAQYFVSAFNVTRHALKATTNLIAFQCLSCSHVQSDTSLVPYYKDVISTASLSPAIVDHRDSIIRYITGLLGEPNPSILEIGAFQGEYLEHLKNLGYSNLTGIEHKMESVNNGRIRGVNLIEGYILDDTPLYSDSLPADVLLCFNFLEHIPDPFRFLQIAKHKFLSSPAYLYLTMPSFEYIRKTNLLQEFVPDHLSYFTLQSLQTLFARCNLQVLSINEINNCNDLEIVAKSLSYEPVSLDQQPFLNLISKINQTLFESRASSERVAFWGAGHRSLTLISQLNHHYIDFIVDSARFKQGLICPDTCLPIISPEDFFNQPADVLFVSLPGIYADEVCLKLQQADSSISKIFVIAGNSISLVKY
jgi:hypothetical protein